MVTTERFKIELPAEASQAELDYAIAELRLFQIEHEGTSADPARIITHFDPLSWKTIIFFFGLISSHGLDLNRLIWPNARDTGDVLAELGTVKP